MVPVAAIRPLCVVAGFLCRVRSTARSRRSKRGRNLLLLARVEAEVPGAVPLSSTARVGFSLES